MREFALALQARMVEKLFLTVILLLLLPTGWLLLLVLALGRRLWRPGISYQAREGSRAGHNPEIG